MLSKDALLLFYLLKHKFTRIYRLNTVKIVETHLNPIHSMSSEYFNNYNIHVQFSNHFTFLDCIHPFEFFYGYIYGSGRDMLEEKMREGVGHGLS